MITSKKAGKKNKMIKHLNDMNEILPYITGDSSMKGTHKDLYTLFISHVYINALWHAYNDIGDFEPTKDEKKLLFFYILTQDHVFALLDTRYEFYVNNCFKKGCGGRVCDQFESYRSIFPIRMKEQIVEENPTIPTIDSMKYTYFFATLSQLHQIFNYLNEKGENNE